MKTAGHASLRIIEHPWRFLLQVLKGFRANQGFLLAGAVAYYTLLSIVPLFSFLLIVLSKVVDQTLLLATVSRVLALVIPGETALVVEQLRRYLENGSFANWLLLALLFFSSMAFTTLENAMSVIFHHRGAVRRRHFAISVLLPYLFILLLGAGLLVTSVISSVLQTISQDYIEAFGHVWNLDRVSIALLYLIGVAGEILLLTSIYLVMPVGRLSVRHALVGGIAAGLLWEITRRIVVWYFATLSLVNVVYGSLATSIVALLTLEVASIILLLGAQVIAEYERLERSMARTTPD